MMDFCTLMDVEEDEMVGAMTVKASGIPVPNDGTMAGWCQPYQARRGNGQGPRCKDPTGRVANLTC